MSLHSNNPLIAEANAKALPSIQSWLKGGHQENNDWVALNPTRLDENEGSFRVNLSTGGWIDHATGEKGSDAVSLYAYIKGIGQDAQAQITAAKEILGASFTSNQYRSLSKRNKDTQSASSNDAKSWMEVPVSEIPQNEPSEQAMKKDGKAPIAKTPYRDRQGHVLFWVLQYPKQNGKKDFSWLTYRERDGKKQWRHQGPSAKSILAIEQLKEGDRILIVEGEKCQKAATESLASKGFKAVTWPGGVTGKLKADWDGFIEVLKEIMPRELIIWPDNDDPGREAAHWIANRLREFNPRILTIPEDKPEKWDVADAVEEGTDPLEIIQRTESTDIESLHNEIAGLDKISALAKVIQKLFGLRYNEVLCHYEFRKGKEWIQLTDRYENSKYNRLRTTFTKFSKLSRIDFNSVVESEATPEYHPFKEFFNSLPEWDGDDHITRLFECINLKNRGDYQVGLDFFRRWLIAAVAQSTGNPGPAPGRGENHTALIFASDKQGTYKTTFFRTLGKSVAGEKYVHAGAINPGDKDDRIRLSSNFLILLDELESTTKAELGALKSLFTLPSENIRLPFGKRKEFMERTASFCGSVNDSSRLLTDHTGSRRWLILEIDSIDFTTVQTFDFERLWSQCLSLLESGEKYWFDGEDLDMLNERNKAYYSVSTEEELFLEFFDPLKPDESIENMTYVEKYTASVLIAEIKRLHLIVLSSPSIDIKPVPMGKALTALNCKRERKSNSSVYFVRKNEKTKKALEQKEIEKLERMSYGM